MVAALTYRNTVCIMEYRMYYGITAEQPESRNDRDE